MAAWGGRGQEEKARYCAAVTFSPNHMVGGIALDIAQPVEAKRCWLEQPCTPLDLGDGLRSAPDVVKS